MRDLSRRLGAVLLCLVTALPGLAAPKITVTGAAPPGERPVLAVLATAEYASALEGARVLFEAQCGCALAVTQVEDALALPSALAGAAQAEVALGLPLSLLEEARLTGRIAPHGRPAPLALPVAWSDADFMPVAYGWLGFAYDTTRLTAAPISFTELAKAGPNALRIAVDDPRAAATGLDALAWMRAVHKDEAGALWARIKPKMIVAKSRAAALAMLEKGEADLALASTTWPATRAMAQAAPRYRVAPFREGQLLLIETAALLKDAAHPQLAAQFLAFLTTSEAQALIAARRGLYPVHPGAAVPEAFGKVTLPSWSIALTAQEIAAKRAEWRAEWDAALAR